MFTSLALAVPSLDADTLIFGAFTVSLLVVLLLAAFWRRHAGRVGGLGAWCSGAAVLTVGNLLFLFEQDVPAVLAVVGANGLVIVGMNLAAVGMYRFAERRADPLLQASLALAALKVIVLLAYVAADVPGPRVREVVSAGAVTVAAAAGLRGLPRALWRTLPGVLFGSASVAIVLVGLVRIAQVFSFPDAGSAASSPRSIVFASVYFATLTAQLVSLTLFVPQRLYEHEQAMKARLDLLYRELNHRVGNNLNVIYNTLDLARANLDDDAPSRAVLTESQNLVGTITAMHRALTPGRDGTSDGALDAYLATLARQALDSFSLPHVRLETAMDPTRADAKTLRNCGLIVNELVTNACKYAFAGRAEGAVTLRLARTPLRPAPGAPPRQRLQVTVADDGAGLPAPWGEGEAQGTGLGRALVDGLLRDLNATLDVATRPDADGTRFTWTFEANDPAAAPAG